MMHPFFSVWDITRGTWCSFERNVARLLLHLGFENVRLVGGAGDHGADVLATCPTDGKMWAVQCKFAQHGNIAGSKNAVKDVAAAGKVYGADVLLLAVSGSATTAVQNEVRARQKKGIEFWLWNKNKIVGMARECPLFIPSRKELREYQKVAVKKMVDEIAKNNKASIAMATGLGKTVIMAEVVANMFERKKLPHERCLVLAHTKEIVDNLHCSFWEQIPKTISTHQLDVGAFPHRGWKGIAFGTIQCVSKNVAEFSSDIDMVVIDEAHHASAPTYRDFLESSIPEIICGATATPWRGDGADIEGVVGRTVVKIGISEGLRLGYLSEVDYRLLFDGIDWPKVERISKRKFGRPYSIKDLNRKLIIPVRDIEAAGVIKKVFHDERRSCGVVFCLSKNHANQMTKVLRGMGLRVGKILGNTPKRERGKMLAQLGRKQLDFLCGVDVFNEGVDIPEVDIVVFMRQTHSRRIFVQQLGRGLRISKHKDKVIVLDFVSDLLRIAEILQIERSGIRPGGRKKLVTLGGVGKDLVDFRNQSAKEFLKEWLLDQADLLNQPTNHSLEILPKFDFPQPLSGNSRW